MDSAHCVYKQKIMNTQASTKYVPGDRVIALRWPRDGAGTVIKSATVRVLVRWDGFAEDKRTSIADVRPETAEDIELRAYAESVRAWNGRQPQNACVAIVLPMLYGSTAPDGVRLYGDLLTPESMREAADELIQLADWFAAKPVKL